MPSQPRYVDLQINGYAGVDFNRDNLSEVDLHSACERLHEDGVAGVLATIITAEIPTHTPDSPLYFCSACTDTVEYQLINGKLVGDEPVRIGD